MNHFLKEMKPALNHHYVNNLHHPEHFQAVDSMTLIDIVEMLCDWTAMSYKFKNSPLDWWSKEKKEVLMTPGPSQVPHAVAAAGAVPMMHHRSVEFAEIFERVAAGLKKVFGTEGDVFIIASSGTGAMEASVVNTLSPGDRVVVGNTGKFGDMFKAGIIDPAKVARTALQSAASVAGLMLTTNVLVTDLKDKDEEPAPGAVS